MGRAVAFTLYFWDSWDNRLAIKETECRTKSLIQLGFPLDKYSICYMEAAIDSL